MAEIEEELKNLLIKMKKETEKPGLKLNIQKMKIIPSSPITLCQIDREKNGNRDRLYFFVSKIPADGDCSHEIKTFLERKAMTNLYCVLKSRDIILPSKSI